MGSEDEFRKTKPQKNIQNDSANVVHVYIYICMYVRTYVCMYVCVRVRVRVYTLIISLHNNVLFICLFVYLLFT